MNRQIRDRILRSRDGRNPYGSRGGYVTSRAPRRRRDRGEDYDYDRRYEESYDDEYSSYVGDSANSERGGARGGRGVQRGGRYSDNRGGVDRRDMNYDDYNDYGEFEYNYDMHEQDMEIPKKEIKRWMREIENTDGSRGAKFTEEQLVALAQQHGVKFDEFTESEFYATVNMMYSDYCKAVKEMGVPNFDRPEPYIKLAKSFLCDDDFEGEPYQKLALYFYDIVRFEK